MDDWQDIRQLERQVMDLDNLSESLAKERDRWRAEALAARELLEPEGIERFQRSPTTYDYSEHANKKQDEYATARAANGEE